MVQSALRDVKLSDRARSRVEQARDVQKIQKPHDIRNMIPKVAWTDPASFPPYVFREYPKMPLLDGNRPIKLNESGDLLMFYDIDDEREFKDNNPDLVNEIERNEPTKQAASAIAVLTDEVSELRERLRAAGLDPDAGKRKKPASGGLAAAVRDEPETSASTEGSELRDQLKAAGGGGSAPAQGGNPLKNKKKDNKAA